MMPMFLFSTAFFLLGVYPRWLQVFVECRALSGHRDRQRLDGRRGRPRHRLPPHRQAAAVL